MSTRGDFEAVKKDIAKLLHQPEYDDGSAGPVLVRLAWYVFHLGLHLTIPIINLRTPQQILTSSQALIRNIRRRNRYRRLQRSWNAI
jgi:hypothetical protein